MLSHFVYGIWRRCQCFTVIQLHHHVAIPFQVYVIDQNCQPGSSVTCNYYYPQETASAAPERSRGLDNVEPVQALTGYPMLVLRD